MNSDARILFAVIRRLGELNKKDPTNIELKELLDFVKEYIIKNKEQEYTEFMSHYRRIN